MGAVIFFNKSEVNKKDEGKFISTYVNSSYWDAFGDLLDAVFLPNYPKLHEIIKSEEGEYLKFYSFVELDKEQFNQSVKLIRDYIAKQSNPTEWQKMAQVVWNEIAEPYIIKDNRYQPS
ncbi:MULTISPECIES: hypothetical protein [unclassified Gilliamella]|jgi:hypothetical protein|uniref:hypothetical protein n=1 Tax=unclassified Gilliamella TaxID=2685620 RepID=UPI00080DFD9A|nr:hypothetical protein [Gilliamella apicola]OCG14601.1 hypothetical protein A9G47_03530 [Gilliamella apicola]OCG76506.1 hypothetical protein A9G42_07780 [Gilliamella apicola]